MLPRCLSTSSSCWQSRLYVPSYYTIRAELLFVASQAKARGQCMLQTLPPAHWALSEQFKKIVTNFQKLQVKNVTANSRPFTLATLAYGTHTSC